MTTIAPACETETLPWSAYHEARETVLERYERLRGVFDNLGQPVCAELLAALHTELLETARALERKVSDGFEELQEKYGARITDCLVMLARLEELV